MTAHVLPDGWRWESYGGVEVGVPGDWGWDNGSQRLGQWFVGPRSTGLPVVGRPGVSTLVGEPAHPDGLDPGVLVANTGPMVVFGRAPDPAGSVQDVGDRTTVRLGGAEVCVQVGQPLRDRIVATIHAVDVDSHGCPSTHRLSSDPSSRPDPAVDVSALTGVTSLAIGKYVVGPDSYASDPRLASSLRYEGAEAVAVIGAVADAPVGGGPDAPETCLPEVSYGDEIIVARVWSDVGESEFYVRYSSCDHNGFDDGVTIRTLTADSLAPFIAGPNAVHGSVSGVMAAIVWPRSP